MNAIEPKRSGLSSRVAKAFNEEVAGGCEKILDCDHALAEANLTIPVLQHHHFASNAAKNLIALLNGEAGRFAFLCHPKPEGNGHLGTDN